MRTQSEPNAMKAIRRIVSPILNFILEPIVCRVADRLRSPITTLDAKLETKVVGRLDELERMLVSPFLPAVIKDEAQNIADLPLPLLKTLPEPAIIGYLADDVAALLPGSTILPATQWISGCGINAEVALPHNLLFLDEYYFLRSMQRLYSPLFAVRGSLIVATRFKYLPEMRCRTLLHQLGFMEILLVARDASTEQLVTFSVSHAAPVTGHPIFLDENRPPRDPLSPSVWLVAHKTAQHGTPASFSHA
jgi:hypothetical protein